MSTFRALGLAARGSVALAISAAAIAIGGTAASAATTSGGPITAAAASTTPKTITVVYACDLSAYGGTAPVDMTAVIGAPTSATAGSSVAVSFSSQAINLPTEVSSNATMQTVTGVSFSAVATVSGAGNPGSVTLKSTTAGNVLSKPTSIPATPASGNVTLAEPGTVVIDQPATVQILPADAQASQLTPITCSTSTAAQSITLTVTQASVTPPSAPVYSCTFSGGGQSSTLAGPLPMSLRVAGKLTTGSTDTITFVTPSNNQGGLGGPWTGASKLIFQASLPVTGAQHGTVTVYRATTDVGLTVLKVTGSLFLSQPGTIYVHLPQKLKLTLIANLPNGRTASAVISCTSKAPAVGLTLKVTGSPVTPPAPQGTATPVPSGTGTPVGAPNTGGGRPASNLPLVAGGAALLAVGAGLAVTARRRRHSEN